MIDFIKEKEAASILGFNVQTLRNRRFLKKGPPYFKIGSSVRYSKLDIQDFIKNSRVLPKEEA